LVAHLVAQGQPVVLALAEVEEQDRVQVLEQPVQVQCIIMAVPIISIPTDPLVEVVEPVQWEPRLRVRLPVMVEQDLLQRQLTPLAMPVVEVEHGQEPMALLMEQGKMGAVTGYVTQSEETQPPTQDLAEVEDHPAQPQRTTVEPGARAL
jgi:hypothetical protein